MLRAYETYKASVNRLKKEKTGEAPTAAQRTIASMDATGRKIEALDPRNLSPEEMADLATAMNGLKGILEIALSAITEPEMPEMVDPPEERDLKAY